MTCALEGPEELQRQELEARHVEDWKIEKLGLIMKRNDQVDSKEKQRTRKAIRRLTCG